ncbi:MAG: ABC transporter permease [Deltaproteobacteria bacterium]|nr:ABC transporter permease [Deltaproteobacteria bacterium]MBI3295648.1 ABC transporter permease [Deltaproteobacteria bacterium]
MAISAAIHSLDMVGRRVNGGIAGLGRFTWFLGGTLTHLVSQSLRGRAESVIHHIWIMGVLGTPSAVLSLAFLTAVLIYELAFHLRLIVPQDAMIPSFTSLLVLRELGAVVTAMLLGSRVGAAITAEIATMKSTRQLDALELCGVNLIDFLVVPRVLGCVIASVCLTCLATGGALLITAFTTSQSLGLTPRFFLTHLFLFAEPGDLTICVVKGALFGLTIPIVACFRGLNASSGSEGVGSASTRTVVENSVLVILLDFLVSWLWYAI